MAAAPAPHALRGLGTRSEPGVAKSMVWDFPEVSAGAGEEQEEVLEGRREGKKQTPNLNKYTFPYSF